jgi:hypothetical protein
MPQMTPSQARVIDPILSRVARGFRGNKSPIAELLFPTVPVSARGGTIISFGPDDYKLYSTVRAPGANTRRIQFGHASGNFALVDYRVEGSVPVEPAQEAQVVPGIDLADRAIRIVRNLQSLEREKQAADLARNAALYPSGNKLTLSGASQWSDPTSDPASDIEAAKEAVRQQTGEVPDTLTLGPKVMSALRKHPKLLDRISIASDRNLLTSQQLAALFELKQVVAGGAIYHNGTSFVDVWGKDAILAFTETAGLSDGGSPNFGYTYQLEGYPVVEEPYLDRNANTWFYPVADARQVVLTGPSAGFLFTNASA